MRFCTVVARNYLAYVRVLTASLQSVDPHAAVSVLVLDDVEDPVDDSQEAFEIIRPADLDIEAREFHHMATIYNVLELATALKPWVLRRLLQADDVVCYLDPDIQVFGPLDQIEVLARRHSIVLTPHSITPLPRDGMIPSELTIRQAGVFNLGFIAVSRASGRFLSWWMERLRRECRIAPEEGLFVDQRWIDFVPSYFEHTVIFDEGYNVAYWNLFERDLKSGYDGYEVNGRPLRFFHFSGFDPQRPYALSKHQVGTMRIQLENHFEVAHLCDHYSAQVLAAGHRETVGAAYHYGFTANGVPLDDRSRRVYRDALEALERDAFGDDGRSLPDPFDADGATEFEQWLDTPDPDGKTPRVSRYLAEVYRDRRDIAMHFPHVDEPDSNDADDFVDWMRMHGRSIAGALPEYVPPPIPTSTPRPSGLEEGVNVVGYLRAEDGIGSVARSVLDVLHEAHLPVSPRTCTATRSRQSAGRDEIIDDVRVTYDATITCVNADQFPLLPQQLGGLLPLSTYNIGVWAWEVEVFPKWMARSEVLVDEVWTYSRHAADAIKPACTVPVHVFAPPVFVPPEIDAVDRAGVGLTDDFTFLFCFDLASGFERKNPLGVVRAFCRAFAPGAGPRLLIKTVNGGSTPAAWSRLQLAVEGRPDISVRDGYETAEHQRSLTAAADCYVSLHRAEGYGLTLAEAMAVGRPVIGTGYSGNLEFMTDDTSVLVPYEKTRVPFGCAPYPPNAFWAEPDLESAAEAMRTLASDPEAAARLGARAREHMITRHTAAARVDFVRGRLHELRTNR